MDYTALKTLLDSDPANADKTDADAAAWCNEKAHSAVGKLGVDALTEYLLETGEWTVIRGAAADAAHAAHALAKAVREDLADATQLAGIANVDFGKTRYAGMLAQLRDAGLISIASHDAVIALATRQVSRAENAGISSIVYPEDVNRARSL